MTAADWIAEQRVLLDAATEGPWEAEPLEGNITTPTEGNVIEVYAWRDADAYLIADSRTSLPLALNAIEAVLELHDSESSHYSPFAGRTVTTCGACGEPRPCPTVAAITSALGTKEQS